MKRFSLIIFSALILAGAIFTACDDDEQCREENYVMLNVRFYKSVIDTLGKQTNSTFYVDSVTAYGVNVDSVLYNNTKNINYIDLPLNKFTGYSEFDIVLNDTLERLRVWHSNVEEYLSFECGCLITHVIDSFSLTGNYFDPDSLVLYNNGVNTSHAENIQLYRRYNNNK